MLSGCSNSSSVDVENEIPTDDTVNIDEDLGAAQELDQDEKKKWLKELLLMIVNSTILNSMVIKSTPYMIGKILKMKMSGQMLYGVLAL